MPTQEQTPEQNLSGGPENRVVGAVLKTRHRPQLQDLWTKYSQVHWLPVLKGCNVVPRTQGWELGSLRVRENRNTSSFFQKRDVALPVSTQPLRGCTKAQGSQQASSLLSQTALVALATSQTSTSLIACNGSVPMCLTLSAAHSCSVRSQTSRFRPRAAKPSYSSSWQSEQVRTLRDQAWPQF